MGLDSDGTKFLFAAHAAGVSFRKTAMLGRQDFFPEIAQLQSLLDLRGAKLSAHSFLANSEGYAEKWFEFLGADEVTAIDNSDYEGAGIVSDLNAPLDPNLKGRYTAVLDGGCLEHVFNFPQAIKNCMEMLEVGGHFIAISPANNFCGHGFYQFSPELFFRVFTEANGFENPVVLTKEKSTWLRVSDPEEFGGRVEMQNNRPTYLFVLARKMATGEILLQPPQQSDYARQWENSGRQAHDTEQRPGRPLAAKLRSSFPVRWKETLRPLAANVSIERRYECYRPLDEAALLRGEFNRQRTK